MTTEPNIKEGLPLNNNYALEIKYSEALRALVRKMTTGTNSEILDLFRREDMKRYFKLPDDDKNKKSMSLTTKLLLSALFLKYQKLFDKEGGHAVKAMIMLMNRYSSTAVSHSLSTLAGKEINAGKLTKPIANVIHALTTENRTLVSSLASQYFTNVTGLVMRAVSTGLVDDIPEQLDKQENIVLRRANTIAVDQCRKAMQSISKQKMIDAGFKNFQWIYTYRSKEPRPSHIKLGGQIFNFDDPPVTNADNHNEPPRKGFPGSEVNCKCIMRPVAEWEKSKNAISKR